MTRVRLSILIGLSTICILGHFLCPPQYTFIHEFLFKLTYLPIVLSALWTSRKISLVITALFCFVYIFHIFEHLFHHAYPHLFSIFFDLGLYVLVAWVAGGLSDSQKAHATKLTEAYAALKEKTAMLVEFEKHALQNERMKTMGELAGTIAHEIRTPLSALQGAVEIVCAESTDESTRQRFSQMIFKEVARLDQVVRDFLNIGRHPRTDLESVDLKAMAEGCVALLSPMASKQNIKISLRAEASMMVRARVDHLTQVLLNLLMNAFNVLGNSGGSIQLKTSIEEDSYKLMVEDNGSGIEPSMRDHLFEPFATSRKEGTGLGLYLSRNLMRSFGGDLYLDSSVSEMTRFVIALPRRTS